MKIFGIGLNRTGTSSLSVALVYLGYKTAHFIDHERNKVIDIESVLHYDALTDTPISCCFEQLDAKFPGSKFIYTVRDSESWLRSCAQRMEKIQNSHPFVQDIVQLRLKVFGTPVFDEKLYLAAYERHETRVLHYFKQRRADLLSLDICGGNDWAQLCPFLGKSIPKMPFPRANIGVKACFEAETREFLLFAQRTDAA